MNKKLKLLTIVFSFSPFILHAQNIKIELRKNWITVLDSFENASPDTLRIYNNSDYERPKYKFLIIWKYKNGRFGRVTKDETSGAISDISNTLLEKWKVKHRDGKTYLQIKSEKGEALFQIIPHYKNSTLDEFVLIREMGIYKI